MSSSCLHAWTIHHWTCRSGTPRTSARFLGHVYFLFTVLWERIRWDVHVSQRQNIWWPMNWEWHEKVKSRRAAAASFALGQMAEDLPLLSSCGVSATHVRLPVCACKPQSTAHTRTRRHQSAGRIAGTSSHDGGDDKAGRESRAS